MPSGHMQIGSLFISDSIQRAPLRQGFAVHPAKNWHSVPWAPVLTQSHSKRWRSSIVTSSVHLAPLLHGDSPHRAKGIEQLRLRNKRGVDNVRRVHVGVAAGGRRDFMHPLARAPSISKIGRSAVTYIAVVRKFGARSTIMARRLSAGVC